MFFGVVLKQQTYGVAEHKRNIVVLQAMIIPNLNFVHRVSSM